MLVSVVSGGIVLGHLFFGGGVISGGLAQIVCCFVIPCHGWSVSGFFLWCWGGGGVPDKPLRGSKFFGWGGGGVDRFVLSANPCCLDGPTLAMGLVFAGCLLSCLAVVQCK